MGQTREIVKQADKTPEIKKEIGESLTLLMELCDMKAERFQQHIEENLRTGKIDGESLKIPVDHIISHWSDYRCTTKQTQDITKKVAESIKDIFQGTTESVINGIASLAGSAIEAIVGTGEGTEHTSQVYTCCTDGSGIAASLVRFDMMIWSRNITASALLKYMESALTIVVYKSTIDVSKITFNDFRNIYLEVLERGVDPNLPREKREKEIISAIEFARTVYNELKKDSSNNKPTTIEDLRNRVPVNLVKTTQLKKS